MISQSFLFLSNKLQRLANSILCKYGSYSYVNYKDNGRFVIEFSATFSNPKKVSFKYPDPNWVEDTRGGIYHPEQVPDETPEIGVEGQYKCVFGKELSFLRFIHYGAVPYFLPTNLMYSSVDNGKNVCVIEDSEQVKTMDGARPVLEVVDAVISYLKEIKDLQASGEIENISWGDLLSKNDVIFEVVNDYKFDASAKATPFAECVLKMYALVDDELVGEQPIDVIVPTNVCQSALEVLFEMEGAEFYSSETTMDAVPSSSVVAYNEKLSENLRKYIGEHLKRNGIAANAKVDYELCVR